MQNESKEQKYSKVRRRINLPGLIVFVGVTAAFMLTTTRVFNEDWTAWWVGAGGLLLGFTVALAVSFVMDYLFSRDYAVIQIPLWEYVLIRFRFLFVLFLIPMAITMVLGVIVTRFYSGSFTWMILIIRTIAFIVLMAFAGFVLPYLFGKITGAESVGEKIRSRVYDIAEKIGVTIQGVYKVPLEGLRRANAVQIGFVEEKKVVYLLGDWQRHFLKDEISAVLAHEFSHAKNDHIRKLLIAQLLCRVGVPAVILISVKLAINVLEIPKPAQIGVALAFVIPALIPLIGAALFPAWLSRKYETQADKQAAKVCGAGAMISALKGLAEINLIPKKKSHPLSTHPSFEERIRALKSADAP